MDILSYNFGKININGKIYTSDIIIYPDKVNNNWWRKKSHFLQIDDLNNIINYDFEYLIIGTGKYGRMEVSDKLINFLNDKNIKHYIYKTDKAVEKYKDIKGEKIAVLHLTC